MDLGLDGLGDALDDVQRMAIDDAHEHFAQGVAATARANGLTSADSVDIEIESDTDDPGWQIDPERVRRRANEILAGD